MSGQWVNSKSVFWFVFDELGVMWLSTAASYRKTSTQLWAKQSGKPWSYWQRKGYRCHQVKIKYQVQP